MVIKIERKWTSVENVDTAFKVKNDDNIKTSINKWHVIWPLFVLLHLNGLFWQSDLGLKKLSKIFLPWILDHHGFMSFEPKYVEYYCVSFGIANFAYVGLILSWSQFLPLTQLPPKMKLASRVVKIKIQLPRSKLVKLTLYKMTIQTNNFSQERCFFKDSN